MLQRRIRVSAHASCSVQRLATISSHALRCFDPFQVRIYGGAASSDITASTTHVVVVPAGHSGRSEVLAGQLLGQLLREHGGLPALKTLHRRLQAQHAHVVTAR